MSKLVPILLAGTGTATASVGGFYLVRRSGAGMYGENAQQTEGDASSIPTRTALVFDSVDVFKKN